MERRDNAPGENLHNFSSAPYLGIKEGEPMIGVFHIRPNGKPSFRAQSVREDGNSFDSSPVIDRDASLQEALQLSDIMIDRFPGQQVLVEQYAVSYITTVLTSPDTHITIPELSDLVVTLSEKHPTYGPSIYPLLPACAQRITLRAEEKRKGAARALMQAQENLRNADERVFQVNNEYNELMARLKQTN